MTGFIVEELDDILGATIAEHEALEQHGPCEVIDGPFGLCGNLLGISWVDSDREPHMVCWKHVALSRMILVRAKAAKAAAES